MKTHGYESRHRWRLEYCTTQLYIDRQKNLVSLKIFIQLNYTSLFVWKLLGKLTHMGTTVSNSLLTN